MRNVTKKQKIKEAELFERIAGHFVPHEAMVNTKNVVKVRYRRFLALRAELLAQRIKELAQPPA